MHKMLAILSVVSIFACAKNQNRSEPSRTSPAVKKATTAPTQHSRTKSGSKLTKISGASSIRVGQSNLKPGAHLYIDDRLQTNGTTALQLGYPDGSIAMVGQNTLFVVRQVSGTPELDLREGEIRALIAKGQTKKHKFRIKTRSSVMGVRGTDVVVKSQGTQSSVHTLAGNVDVAKNSSDLNAGRTVAVPAGKFTSPKVGQAIPAVKSFNVGNYLKGFNSRNPAMGKLLSKVDKTKYVDAAAQKVESLKKAIPKKVPPKPKIKKPKLGF